MEMAAQHFASLFPPLLAREATDAERGDAVDIDARALAVAPLEQAVESHIYHTLQRWNAVEPAKHEATLTYMQRLQRYRAVARWVLYESDVSDDEQDGGAATSERQRAKKRTRRHQEMAKYMELFATLPPLQTLRDERRPSDRVAAFAAKYPIKKALQAKKRSFADTQTALCFEFGRRPPPPRIGTKRAENEEDSDDDGEQQGTGIVSQQAATWRSRTLLASVAKAPTVASKQELLLWVDVLHPTKDPAKTQSFLVLGSQPLCELLDLVACAYDQRLAAHTRKGKTLYFAHTFYVDGRDRDSGDYSQEILQWIHAKPSRIAKYLGDAAACTVKPLETTTFDKLPLKIDTPGVYIHQGECEHLVRLRDARLVHEWDSTNREEDFPMRLPNLLYRQLRSCFVCAHHSAKYVTYGDRLATSDPMFFCERCYKAAHYGSDDKLLYEDFQVFPYIQD